MANDYDKILKEILGHAKTSLIKLLTEAEIVSIKPLPWKIQHTRVEKEADTVAEVTIAYGQNLPTHLEWQLATDASRHERMLFYNGRQMVYAIKKACMVQWCKWATTTQVLDCNAISK